MFKYEIIIVLFNTGIDDSETLLSLYKTKDFLSNENHIIVWDNSIAPSNNNEAVLLEKKYYPCTVTYYWDGTNYSLSYIFNRLRKQVNSRYTIILDHDTTIPEDFFVMLDHIIANEENEGINLFLPVLKSCKKIVSPAFEYKFTHRQISENIKGQITCNHLQAMNSGMIINSTYYRDIFPGYNVNLKFYGTDNDFMRKYRKQNNSAYILPLSFNHRSNFREDPLPQRVKRFVAIKEAAIILAREDGLLMALFERFRYFLISVKYDLKDHTFLFTKSLFIFNSLYGRE